jgi:hypothetical protein
VKEHFRERRTAPATISVPEWGTEGEPAIIHVFPLTLRQRRKIYTKGDGQPRDAAGVQAHILIVAAFDASGAPLFSEMDENDLLTKADALVVGRVAAAIMTSAESIPVVSAKT